MLGFFCMCILGQVSFASSGEIGQTLGWVFPNVSPPGTPCSILQGGGGSANQWSHSVHREKCRKEAEKKEATKILEGGGGLAEKLGVSGGKHRQHHNKKKKTIKIRQSRYYIIWQSHVAKYSSPKKKKERKPHTQSANQQNSWQKQQQMKSPAKSMVLIGTSHLRSRKKTQQQAGGKKKRLTVIRTLGVAQLLTFSTWPWALQRGTAKDVHFRRWVLSTYSACLLHIVGTTY